MTEDRHAIDNHVCTFCGAGIYPGETYERDACPPWKHDGATWFVAKRCNACAGTVR